MAEITWGDIYEKGVRVKLRISKWTARKMLNFEELGLEPKSGQDAAKLNKLFTPGVKRLIDKKRMGVFSSLESRARKVLEWNALPLPIDGFFVTDERFIALKTSFDVLSKDFAIEVDKLSAEYEELRKDMENEYREYAAETLFDKVETGELSREEFGDLFVQKIASLYPSPEELKGKFAFTYTVEEVTAPKDFKLEIIDESEQADISAVRKISRKAIQDHYKSQQKELIDSFLNNAAISLRRELVEVCEHIKNVITNGDRFTENSLKSLSSKIDRIRGLNFLGDKEIEGQLKNIDSYLGTDAATYRNDEQSLNNFSNALSDIGQSIRETGITEVEEIVSNFGSLGTRRMRLK